MPATSAAGAPALRAAGHARDSSTSARTVGGMAPSYML